MTELQTQQKILIHLSFTDRFNRIWKMHPTPEKAVGTGIICENCGLLFNQNQEIIKSDNIPLHLSLRHLRCNASRHINIIAAGIIKIVPPVDGKCWYSKYMSRVFWAFIRSDGLAEIAYPAGDQDCYDIQFTRLRLGVYKNDYKVLKYVPILDEQGKDKILQDGDKILDGLKEEQKKGIFRYKGDQNG